MEDKKAVLYSVVDLSLLKKADVEGVKLTVKPGPKAEVTSGYEPVFDIGSSLTFEANDMEAELRAFQAVAASLISAPFSDTLENSICPTILDWIEALGFPRSFKLMRLDTPDASWVAADLQLWRSWQEAGDDCVVSFVKDELDGINIGEHQKATFKTLLTNYDQVANRLDKQSYSQQEMQVLGDLIVSLGSGFTAYSVMVNAKIKKGGNAVRTAAARGGHNKRWEPEVRRFFDPTLSNLENARRMQERYPETDITSFMRVLRKIRPGGFTGG